MCEATSENAGKVLDRLGDQYPDPHIYLDYDSPLELLIATILAAQCTDAKVNEVTPMLWEEYPTPEDIADAEPENLHEILRPTGFYRRKTKSVQNCCRALVKKYDGDVPENLSQLTELPGVGRKTANVVLANAFDQEAIAVDTHVKRVSKRIGLARNDKPDKIERELREIIPEERWTKATLLFSTHGRQICSSQNPECENCPISDLCDYFHNEVES